MPLRFFRTGFFAICAAALILGGAQGVHSGQAKAGSFSSSRAGTILVFPFENQSRVANVDWLGEGLSELTVERLQDRALTVFSREDRLAALEKIGLPDSARFSHATMVKIAAEVDADVVVYGKFLSDGKTVTMVARVLHVSPPRLSAELTQTGTMAELSRAHAHLTWQILCAIEPLGCPAETANRDESSFSDPPASLHMDALESFVRGVTEADEQARLRDLREAARLEPAWDRPAYQLGQLYFARHDCESALPWFSRVPPNRPDGAEISFETGVCHLQRNDPARADATFSGLIERSRAGDSKSKPVEFPEARNDLGIARLREGKLVEAASEFEHAATLDSDEPDYWFNFALAKLAVKQPAAAIAPLEHVRRLDADDKDAKALLIATLESVGRAADAAAIRAEPSDPGAVAASPVPKDTDGFVRMARVSKIFDRSLLRSTSDSPSPPPAKVPGKSDGSGVQR